MAKDFDPNIGKDTQFKPGESGNPDGKPKGAKHLKTLIQEIGNNIDWNKTTLKDKDGMRSKYGNNAWEAITYVALTKAMAGDPKAMDWLSKNGYGQNIDVTTGGEKLEGLVVVRNADTES